MKFFGDVSCSTLFLSHGNGIQKRLNGDILLTIIRIAFKNLLHFLWKGSEKTKVDHKQALTFDAQLLFLMSEKNDGRAEEGCPS